MKLILANNQTERFRAFYDELKSQTDMAFEYSAYDTLLFMFDTLASEPVRVRDVRLAKSLTDFDGIYINGYVNTLELAVTVAICCEALHIGYVNHELQQAPSLSKLSMYARLAAAGVTIPPTLAGAKTALLAAEADLGAMGLAFPLVLKRADADRGIDNYKVTSFDEVRELLASHDSRSVWLLQAYIENNGYYRLNYYDYTPAFCIFRTLEPRPDGDERRAHMYKPKGGSNARLVDLGEVPSEVLAQSERSVQVSRREIGSVDCIYDQEQGRAYVLEVNYNPQLVTIETFKEVRVKAFLDYLQRLGDKA